MQTDSDFLFGWDRRERVEAVRGFDGIAGWLLAVLVAVLFAANVALHFPGVLNNDSIGQYKQAVSGRYGDWHPPVMAWLWSQLLHVADGPGPLLVLHLALYWLGFGLVADGVRRAGHARLAIVVAAAGAFPPFLYVNAQIVKDVGMAVTWLAAVGALFWYRSQQRRIPIAVGIGIALLLAYGSLVRTNAIFGLGPILLYALAPQHWLRNLRLMVAAVVVAVLALPVGQVLNQQLFRPVQQNAMQSLFLFDLMGIAVHTGDPDGAGAARHALARGPEGLLLAVLVGQPVHVGPLRGPRAPSRSRHADAAGRLGQAMGAEHRGASGGIPGASPEAFQFGAAVRGAEQARALHGRKPRRRPGASAAGSHHRA
jgi:hypothetical protein